MPEDPTEFYMLSILAEMGILLIGGDKTGGDSWYERFVPVADKLYDEHLAEISTKPDG
jgi:hypothetical protein